MVEQLRNKWCEDLEDLLQCPICFERPRNEIFQCMQGHHICVVCIKKVSACPTCCGQWSTSRNRLAENLCSKLDDIKLSLIDPEAEINKLILTDRASIATQTEEALSDGAAAAAPSPKKPVDAHAGPYPCRLSACGRNSTFENLLKHIKIDHFTQFIELPLGEGAVFQHTWPIDYTEQMTFDRAFEVPSMGIFFLKLSSDVFGNFTGFILMLHNGFISKQFTYQLEISCCPEHPCVAYKGEVCSCRTPAMVLKEKSLQASRSELCRMTVHEKVLKCTVLIGKKPQTEETETLSNQQNKKKNPQYQNNGGGRRRGVPRFGPPHPHSDPQNHRQPRPQTAYNGQAPPPLFPPRTLSMNRRPASATPSISNVMVERGTYFL